MWDKIKAGLKDIAIEFLTAVAGAIAGAKIIKEAEKSSMGEAIGTAAGKVLFLDRDTFRRELQGINAATNGGVQKILDLLHKLNRSGGVKKIAGEFRREERVIRTLQMIAPEYRQTDYMLLNDLLERDPSGFFAELDILENDGYAQFLKQLYLAVEPHVKATAEKSLRFIEKRLQALFGVADKAALIARLEAIKAQLIVERDELDRIAQMRGLKGWWRRCSLY